MKYGVGSPQSAFPCSKCLDRFDCLPEELCLDPRGMINSLTGVPM